ncbi:MAG: rRNA maturation RNase YbeY [Patescibacteria group bacterium]
MLIEVSNQTVDKVNARKIKNSIRKILRLLNKNLNLSIVFVSPAAMKRINQKWRNKNTVTDILSFGNLSLPVKQAFDGELILCLKQIKKQAQKIKRPQEKELVWLLIHGILHVLGYNHQSEKEEKRMNSLAQFIFK